MAGDEREYNAPVQKHYVALSNHINPFCSQPVLHIGDMRG